MHRLLIVLAALGVPLTGEAIEVKVVDQTGVVRAVRDLKGAGRVTIKLLENEPTENVVLERHDGTKVLGEKDTERGFIFREVQEGTWKLPFHSRYIEEVKIYQ